MKRRSILFFTILLSIITFAQNKKIKDPRTSAPMLIGEINRDAFQDSVFSWWFNSEYNMYEIDSTSLETDKGEINNYKLTLVMGTWCSDSRREVPRFFKILDYLHFPKEKIKMIAVDRSKKSQNNELDSLNIKRVPTFIFYKDYKEKGRIIETPLESLEKDITKIISNKH